VVGKLGGNSQGIVGGSGATIGGGGSVGRSGAIGCGASKPPPTIAAGTTLQTTSTQVCADLTDGGARCGTRAA
jgi:hypothetical protein